MSLSQNGGVSAEKAAPKSCGPAAPVDPEQKKAGSKVVTRLGDNSSPTRHQESQRGAAVIIKKKPMEGREGRDGGRHGVAGRRNGARNSSVASGDDNRGRNSNGSTVQRPETHRNLVSGVLSCFGWCYKQRMGRGKLPRTIIDGELSKSLPPEKIDVRSWEFDVFCVDKKLKGHSLEVVFMELLEILDLYKSMKLDRELCCNYIRAIAGRYKNNPYHNCMHATDVLQAVGVILLRDNYHKQFAPQELLALVLAAAVHDVAHPGVNNKFHLTTGSELAHRYESSMNEQMHIQCAYDSLGERNDTQNMLKTLPEEDRNLIKAYIKNIILATDMAFHFTLVDEFRNHFPRKNGHTVREASQEEKDLLLRMIVHCADISNPTRPLELCRQWSHQIAEEMWRQGDRERKKGYDPSEGCDRHASNLAKAQKDFIEQYVIPCFETLSSVVPEFTEMALANAERNKTYWEKESHSN